MVFVEQPRPVKQIMPLYCACHHAHFVFTVITLLDNIHFTIELESFIKLKYYLDTLDGYSFPNIQKTTIEFILAIHICTSISCNNLSLQNWKTIWWYDTTIKLDN